MTLVPHRRGGREEEGSGHHGADEGEPEQRERMVFQRGPIPGPERVSGCRGTETLGWEDRTAGEEWHFFGELD